MTVPPPNRPLPWPPGSAPLMLAPMQGLTNRALRAWFCEKVRPDTVFTEFLRVKGTGLARSDRQEIVAPPAGVPLVVQLVGYQAAGLAAAARTALQAGAEHLNLNMGCPYGRMTSALTGGAMLRRPEALPDILAELREAAPCSLSIKLRAGFDNPRQIFSLLPLFEKVGIDFLVLHPRTVVQQYGGRADHALTAEVVRATRLPVIANGDIIGAEAGRRILAESRAAGLMLGRGAIGDPYLFRRLRGEEPDLPTAARRMVELQAYLGDLALRYRNLFCGDTQALAKLKEVLAFIAELELGEFVRRLRRTKSLEAFLEVLVASPGLDE